MYNRLRKHKICNLDLARDVEFTEEGIPIIKSSKLTLPDFSVYLDAPFAVNLWNIYRGRFLAAMFQKNGINIIPNLSVVTHDLEKYTFSGVESGGIFAVSNVQANNYIFRHHWFNFVRNAIEKLSPQKIIVYGNKMTISSHTNVVYFENENIKRLRTWKKN